MNDNNYWTRSCKTKDCFNLAKPLSDYCKECHKKRLEKLEELENE
jgi:hypothetical protein